MIGMTYRDPHVEGVVGTRPKDGTHWAYQYESVVVGKERYYSDANSKMGVKGATSQTVAGI
ncbi:MAG: hypothetical protein QW837_07630 [Conexivisphaerales archaeon]